MTFRNELRKTDEFREIAGETARDPSETRTVETPQEAVDPVMSLEKSDVQFWMQVVQVLLLYLILRELSRGGGR
jgi:hypothetical protein